MKKTKWTPGPWVNAGGWVASDSGLKGEYMDIICSLSFVDRKAGEVSDANANLIAAAPELYDALDEVDRAYGSGSNDDKVRAWDKAVKAMAKARGES